VEAVRFGCYTGGRLGGRGWWGFGGRRIDESEFTGVKVKRVKIMGNKFTG
jgi:hypothetical protein